MDVLDVRASKSRPDLGIVTCKATIRNKSGETLLELTTPLMVRTRTAVEAAGG